MNKEGFVITSQCDPNCESGRAPPPLWLGQNPKLLLNLYLEAPLTSMEDLIKNSNVTVLTARYAWNGLEETLHSEVPALAQRHINTEQFKRGPIVQYGQGQSSPMCWSCLLLERGLGDTRELLDRHHISNHRLARGQISCCSNFNIRAYVADDL